MKLPDLLDTVSGDVDATRIFGEPIQIEGATVIPVARIRGGATAGRAEGMLDRGGFKATPVGVFVIRDGEVTWSGRRRREPGRADRRHHRAGGGGDRHTGDAAPPAMARHPHDEDEIATTGS